MNRVVTVIIFFAVISILLFSQLSRNELEPSNANTENIHSASSDLSRSDGESMPPNHESASTSIVGETLSNQTGDSDLAEIIDCGDEHYNIAPEYEERIERTVQSWSESASNEERVNFLLFGQVPEEASRLDLMFELDRKYPSNSLLLMEMLNVCVNSDNPNCSSEFAEYAVQSDPENGAMWMHLISFYAQRNDDKGVYRAIQGLDSADFFNERYGERILHYAQALDSVGANDFIANALYSFATEAGRALAIGPFSRWCMKGEKALNQASACITFGRNLELRSKSMLLRMMGIEIQRTIYEQEGSIEIVAELQRRMNAFYDSHDSSLNKAIDLVWMSEKSLRSWYTNIDTVGEIAAVEIAVEEAMDISASLGPAACHQLRQN